MPNRQGDFAEMTPLRIGISLGDPAGVGPETAAKAIRELRDLEVEFTLFCDARFFEELGRRFRWAAELVELSRGVDGGVVFAGSPEFGGPAPFGRPTPAGGRFAFDSFALATAAALEGRIDALVTAPLSKAGVEMAGVRPFSGHTEYLRDAAGVETVVMMLLAGDFRVVPMTRHVALSRVPSMITPALIEETVRIVADSMVRFEGIKRPAIGVLALNPHAGEGGLFGNEEAVIGASLEALKSRGYDVRGPLVADVAFIPRIRKRFDVIVGMFHDQVLIPLKMAGFERGVNATFGLPFVRTSPDHGTAFDIAGSDSADPSSMIEAIRLAVKWSSANAKARSARSFRRPA